MSDLSKKLKIKMQAIKTVCRIIIYKPVGLCDYDLKSSTNIHFQSITDNIYDFGRPYLLLIFVPVHQTSSDISTHSRDLIHPNDGWTGLYIKL